MHSVPAGQSAVKEQPPASPGEVVDVAGVVGVLGTTAGDGFMGVAVAGDGGVTPSFSRTYSWGFFAAQPTKKINRTTAMLRIILFMVLTAKGRRYIKIIVVNRGAQLFL